MKPAFSTVACPEWTFERIATHAEKWGYLGVELRTFGYASTNFACDPALTAPAKVRSLLERSGLELVSLATGIRYDERITPPVVGMLFDHEHTVRESKSAIDLAVRLEVPFVRVFGYEIVGSEARTSAIARIASRLAKACDYARNSGVKVMIENGGSFSTAAQLAEVMDAVNSPLLVAAYSPAIAALAGENGADGVNVLADRLACLKVRDFANGKACALGDGHVDNRSAVDALGRMGFPGWITYEYDGAWTATPASGHAQDPSAILELSARRLFEWIKTARGPVARPDIQRVMT